MNLIHWLTAMWILSSLLFLHTLVHLGILLIATMRRRRWHLQLQTIWKRSSLVNEAQEGITAGVGEARSSAIPLTRMNHRELSASFVRPKVGWKTAFAAVQEEETGLVELFI
jgi:hypothetical protein